MSYRVSRISNFVGCDSCSAVPGDLVMPVVGLRQHVPGNSTAVRDISEQRGLPVYSTA